MRVVILDPPPRRFWRFFWNKSMSFDQITAPFFGKTFSRWVLEKIIIFPLGVPLGFLGPPEYPKIPDFSPFFKIGD